MSKNEEDFIGIGSRLKQVRKEICGTLREMSRLSGLPISTISEMESARNKPNTKYLLLLVKKYNINLNWVYTGKGSMFQPGFELKFDFGQDTERVLELIYMIENCPPVRYEMLRQYLMMKARYGDQVKEYLPPGKEE